MKWEPLALMAILLGLGLWLVLGFDPDRGLPVREGAHASPIRVANSRGVLEVSRSADGTVAYRVLLRDGFVSREMAEDEVRGLFGDGVVRSTRPDAGSLVFRLLNITGWAGVAWVALGLGGQVLFAGRTVLQWVLSERSRRSVVPTAFWWMSLAGGVALFAYFVWRKDVVGVLGQSSGIVIYARNLKLIVKERRRAAAAPPGA